MVEFGIETGRKKILKIFFARFFPAFHALPHKNEVHFAWLVVVEPYFFIKKRNMVKPGRVRFTERPDFVVGFEEFFHIFGRGGKN